MLAISQSSTNFGTVSVCRVPMRQRGGVGGAHLEWRRVPLATLIATAGRLHPPPPLPHQLPAGPKTDAVAVEDNTLESNLVSPMFGKDGTSLAKPADAAFTGMNQSTKSSLQQTCNVVSIGLQGMKPGTKLTYEGKVKTLKEMVDKHCPEMIRIGIIALVSTLTTPQQHPLGTMVACVSFS